MSVEKCVYKSYDPKRRPSRRWLSWHNHTGAFPRFSFCSTAGLSVGRYKAALEGADADAWEGFAITEHAFSIAIPDEQLAWPHIWFRDSAIVDRFHADGTTARRIGECLDYYASFRDNKRFFTGIEVESNADGVTAIPPDRLREFGFVIASVHHDEGDFADCWRQHFFHLDKALRIPADMVGHPVRRLSRYSSPENPLPREIIDETLDRIRAAGMAVEINAHYPQLHDDVRVLQGAAERGMRVAFSMDLHYPEEFGNWRYFEDVCEQAGIDADKDLKLFDILNRENGK